jgi:hypothetical protein
MCFGVALAFLRDVKVNGFGTVTFFFIFLTFPSIGSTTTTLGTFSLWRWRDPVALLKGRLAYLSDRSNNLVVEDEDEVEEVEEEEEDARGGCRWLNVFNALMLALMSAGELTVRANVDLVLDVVSEEPTVEPKARATTVFLLWPVARSNNRSDVVVVVVVVELVVVSVVKSVAEEAVAGAKDNEADAVDAVGAVVANAASKAAEASFTLALTVAFTRLILKSSNKWFEVCCACSISFSNTMTAGFGLLKIKGAGFLMLTNAPLLPTLLFTLLFTLLLFTLLLLPLWTTSESKTKAPVAFRFLEGGCLLLLLGERTSFSWSGVAAAEASVGGGGNGGGGNKAPEELPAFAEGGRDKSPAEGGRGGDADLGCCTRMVVEARGGGV